MAQAGHVWFYGECWIAALGTIAGIEMFIEQAVKQFELWTGEAAPRAVMEKAAAEALAHTT